MLEVIAKHFRPDEYKKDPNYKELYAVMIKWS
jgi:hypothetical protein